MIFPEFIKPGDTIGVTATSGGIVNDIKEKKRLQMQQNN